MRRLVGALRRDATGIAAVEFALIAPLMIVLYFGLSEATLALMAEKRASHLASTMADLIAQEQQTDAASLGELVSAAPAIMRPFSSDSARLKLRVTSLVADSHGDAKVAWSYASAGQSRRTRGSGVPEMPADLLAPTEGVVLAEVTYEHRPIVGMVLRETLQFNERFYLRPRRTNQVTCPDCPA
ncbi:MAG: TadE/TadG family type IV pilus assembly protein [Phenylobacterium sp.]